MRKILSFLTIVLVCALSTSPAFPQSRNSDNPEVSGDSSQPRAVGAVNPIDLPFADITGRIGEAKELLKSRLSSSGVAGDCVALAALDTATSQINTFSLPKAGFLQKDADLLATTQFGRTVRVHVIRANGVNTAVTIADSRTGQPLVPLTVEFPIVKNGGITEVAYYTSAHPSLLSTEITSAGQNYVRRLLESAEDNLADEGVLISPDIVDVAEHLCIVEHTDHKRFMSEAPGVLFPEILSLYALNQGNTYRFSVSTAGAGGMIQMIPSTYEMVRQQHPNISLTPDFVSGMRDHSNALEAMLLYMNDTWNGLEKSTEVQEALRNGLATKPELLAAGYNSNPARLPLYLRNGGAQWRNLIPSETQMYLAIYSSVDKTLDLGSDEAVTVLAAVQTEPTSIELMSWLSQSLLRGSAFLLMR